MQGLAFIAMVSLLVGLLLIFSAAGNQTIGDYTKQVLQL